MLEKFQNSGVEDDAGCLDRACASVAALRAPPKHATASPRRRSGGRTTGRGPDRGGGDSATSSHWAE